jgi:hypothetical protein
MEKSMRSKKVAVISLIMIFIIAGCAAPLKMTKTNTVNLGEYRAMEIIEIQNDVIGEIDDDIINDIMEEAVDEIEDLDYFDKLYLPTSVNVEENDIIAKIDSVDIDNNKLKKIIKLKVVLTEYDKGNGLLRFLFGIFAGNGKVTLQLSLLDSMSDEVFAEAESTARISGSFSSSQNVVTPLSKAIGNFVEQQFLH